MRNNQHKQIHFPIMAFATGPTANIAWDLLIFHNLDQALAYIEAPEVISNEFTCIDATGRLIEFVAINPEKIELASVEKNPTQGKKLHFLLRYILSNNKESLEYGDYSTKQLIEIATVDWEYKDLFDGFSMTAWIKKILSKLKL